MVTKKNIKFRQTRDGRTEAYDATTGKSLGYVTDQITYSSTIDQS